MFKKKKHSKLPVPPPKDFGGPPAGAMPPPAPGPNEFTPRGEKQMRQNASRARLAPLPPQGPPDTDMDGM